MSSTSPVAIADAIMTDLNGFLTAKPKSTRLYAEPPVIMPDQCPLLAVWCEDTDYVLLTTDPSYERKHKISVAWYVVNMKQSEVGGVGDPQVVHDLDQTVESLITRLATYTNAIPGLGPPQLVTTLASRSLKPIAGSLWRGLIELVADEAA